MFREFRGDDGKVMKSMKYSVNILYTLSMSTQGIGPSVWYVQNYSLIFLVSDRHSTSAIPACECNICWHRHPTCRMSLLRSHHITVTSKSCRRSKTSMLITTQLWICLCPSRIPRQAQYLCQGSSYASFDKRYGEDRSRIALYARSCH